MLRARRRRAAPRASVARKAAQVDWTATARVCSRVPAPLAGNAIAGMVRVVIEAALAYRRHSPNAEREIVAIISRSTESGEMATRALDVGRHFAVRLALARGLKRVVSAPEKATMSGLAGRRVVMAGEFEVVGRVGHGSLLVGVGGV